MVRFGQSPPDCPPACRLDLGRAHWCSLNEAGQAERLEAFLAYDRARGFDMGQAPLMRFALLRIGDGEMRFCWTSHHILLDGWSQPRLWQELYEIYHSLVEGRSAQLEPTRPFRHYIQWLQSQDLTAAERYWREALRGFATPTPLGFGQPGDEDGLKDYRELQIELSATETASVERLGREASVTLNTVVQGAWGLLLSRYSGEQDVVFGATVSGRPPDLTGVHAMIGLFINTLPVRIRVNGSDPVDVWLQNIQVQQAEARQFEHTPLAQLQGWSEVSRGTPLFETLLVFENYPGAPSFGGELDGVQDTAEPDEPAIPLERTSYSITIAVVPAEQLCVRLTYDAERFTETSARHLLAHYRTILSGLANGIGQRVDRIGTRIGSGAPPAHRRLESDDAYSPLPSSLSNVRRAGGHDTGRHCSRVRRNVDDLLRTEQASRWFSPSPGFSRPRTKAINRDLPRPVVVSARRGLGRSESRCRVCASGSELSSGASRVHAGRQWCGRFD